MPETAYIGLGSNLGDRFAYLQNAVTALVGTSGLDRVQASPVYETAPVGVTDQPWFLNAVVRVDCQMTPEALLGQLQRLEAQAHRQRDRHWGPRTLDLDLLLFGARCLNRPELTVPHPQLITRSFVLVPLCDLDPERVHPVTGRTLAEHQRDLGPDPTTRPYLVDQRSAVLSTQPPGSHAHV
jgi:2-amino-4-hydroxy-6-hydroxymethyldihydropteridine diphosphokinase